MYILSNLRDFSGLKILKIEQTRLADVGDVDVRERRGVRVKDKSEVWGLNN